MVQIMKTGKIQRFTDIYLGHAFELFYTVYGQQLRPVGLGWSQKDVLPDQAGARRSILRTQSIRKYAPGSYFVEVAV